MSSKYLRVEMPDGSKYDVPLAAIAQNKAIEYKRSMEDILKEFDSDDYEAIDWAKNNMDWRDVESIAQLVHKGRVDHQEGWLNGEHEVIAK